jgi:hypothetical protein
MHWHLREPANSLAASLNQWRPPLQFHPSWVANLGAMKHVSPAAWRWNLLDTVQKHCVFPFFSPFVPAEIREKQIVWANQRHINTPNDGHFPPSGSYVGETKSTGILQACPQCTREQIEEFGEPYLNRLHHLPGVRICLKHRVSLVKVGYSGSPVLTTLRRVLIDLADNSHSLEVIPSHPLIDFILNSATQLLARPIALKERLDFRTLIRIQLVRKGFRSASEMKRLPAKLQETYRDLNDVIQIARWPDEILHWLRWPHVRFLPIAHLVLFHFLDLTLDEALRHANGYIWKCPNILTDCGLAKTTPQKRLGRIPSLKCEKCALEAFVQHSPPLGSKASIYRLVELGGDLRERIRSLQGRKDELQNLATQTGVPVSAITAVFEKNSGKDQSYEAKTTRLREKYRTTLAQWTGTHPNGTRTQFKRQKEKAYEWFRKNDQEWFEANAPKSRRSEAHSRNALKMREGRNGGRNTKNKPKW